jgi:hypothetical protein
MTGAASPHGKEWLVRHDGPTIPNVSRQEPRAPADAPADAQARNEKLIWPGGNARRQQQIEIRETPGGYVSALAFGISLGANIVLFVALVGLLLFAQAGAFSSGGAFGSSTHSSALSSPTATSSATPSPSATTASLQVTPSSVQLGCDSGQRTQYVILQNTGSAKVNWQATFSVSAQQAGVTISPQRGQLAAGGSISIQLQNTTRSNGSQGGSGRQGVITFTPTASEDNQGAGPDAGSSARLSYTTVGCH